MAAFIGASFAHATQSMDLHSPFVFWMVVGLSFSTVLYSSARRMLASTL